MMTPMDVIKVMSDGNPGSLTALMHLLDNGATIDPDGFMGGLGAIMSLDTLEIYGHEIYMLWDYVCNRDTGKMIAIIRAWQFGQLAGCTPEGIKHAIENNGEGLDLDDVVKAVEAELPNFHADALSAAE